MHFINTIHVFIFLSEVFLHFCTKLTNINWTVSTLLPQTENNNETNPWRVGHTRCTPEVWGIVWCSSWGLCEYIRNVGVGGWNYLSWAWTFRSVGTLEKCALISHCGLRQTCGGAWVVLCNQILHIPWENSFVSLSDIKDSLRKLLCHEPVFRWHSGP